MKKQMCILLLILSMFILLQGMIYSADNQQTGISVTDKSQELQIVTRKINYMNASIAQNILRGYVSFRGRINAVQETNSLIIQDLPEFIVKLQSIIDAMDIKPSDLKFTVFLLAGSTAPKKEGIPNDTLPEGDILKELQAVLKYKSFETLASTIVQIQDNRKSEHRITKNIALQIKPMITKDTIQVDVELGQIGMLNKDGNISYSRLFQTTLSLKNGEKTVMGISKMDGADDALILVMKGEIIQN